MIEPGQEVSNCEGVVKWFSRVRGHGHIVTDKLQGLDVFVHYSDIEGEGYRSLWEGQRVQFDAVPNMRNGRYQGWKAVNVKPLRSFVPD